MIRVASYNIRKAIGTDRRRNPARVMDVLSEIDAEIIVLQEVDRRFGKRQSAIPEEMIAAHGYRVVPFKGKPQSVGHFGNAMLLKGRNTAVHSGEILIPTIEPRGAIFADIECQFGIIRIVGMHLDISGLRRRQQIRSILAQMNGAGSKAPLILMGDCNEWSPHGGSLTEFRGLSVAATAPSFHSRRPIARLDRIITNDRVAVFDSGTHHSLKARYASDHLPVWADIGLI